MFDLVCMNRERNRQKKGAEKNQTNLFFGAPIQSHDTLEKAHTAFMTSIWHVTLGYIYDNTVHIYIDTLLI